MTRPTIQFLITRLGSTTGTAKTYYSVSPDTCTIADFPGNTFPQGAIQFSNGETSKTLEIQPSETAVGGHTFRVVLTSGGANGAISGDAREVAGVIPPYPGPIFSIHRGEPAPATLNGGRPATRFRVTRTQVADGAGNIPAASVDYQVGTSGDARPEDFVGGSFPSGTVEFDTASGDPYTEISTEAYIEVQAIDTPPPGYRLNGRGFRVSLDNPSAGRIDRREAGGQIPSAVVFEIVAA